MVISLGKVCVDKTRLATLASLGLKCFHKGCQLSHRRSRRTRVRLRTSGLLQRSQTAAASGPYSRGTSDAKYHAAQTAKVHSTWLSHGCQGNGQGTPDFTLSRWASQFPLHRKPIWQHQETQNHDKCPQCTSTWSMPRQFEPALWLWMQWVGKFLFLWGDELCENVSLHLLVASLSWHKNLPDNVVHTDRNRVKLEKWSIECSWPGTRHPCRFQCNKPNQKMLFPFLTLAFVSFCFLQPRFLPTARLCQGFWSPG